MMQRKLDHLLEVQERTTERISNGCGTRTFTMNHNNLLQSLPSDFHIKLVIAEKQIGLQCILRQQVGGTFIVHPSSTFSL